MAKSYAEIANLQQIGQGEPRSRPVPRVPIASAVLTKHRRSYSYS
jgi:hypothetical protein